MIALLSCLILNILNENFVILTKIVRTFPLFLFLFMAIFMLCLVLVHWFLSELKQNQEYNLIYRVLFVLSFIYLLNFVSIVWNDNITILIYTCALL